MNVNMHTDRNDVTELIYAIQNIAHSEYHLIELIMNNIDIAPSELTSKVLSLRQIRSDLMKKLSISRPQVNGLWCTLKHLFLTEFHLYELYERQLDKYYLEQALKIHLLIDEFLMIDGIDKFRDCPRCDEDMK